ncbi:MAG: DUF1456 family protein, partial [Spirochaetales bacterium]|nr:DUF1456 family protein [Spirochaetales bacterium]
ACPNAALEHFLDGLIIARRGRKDTAPGALPAKDPLDNNIILKKIRIALELKEDDMLAVFRLGNMEVTKPELSAIFRRKGHKHYKDCGDQMLRNFLKGLTVKFRA